MAGIQLSLNQAEDIYRFFVFGLQYLDSKQSQKAETLFESICLKLNIQQRDIDYLLMKSYLKALIVKKLHDFSQNDLSKYVLRRIFTRLRGGVSSHLFEDLHRSIKSIRHRPLLPKELR